jgi:hypothetical protein
METLKLLCACEESQEDCIAFRAKGHEAYSCDIIPCSGGHPEWHIQTDVRDILNQGWDMMIAHPPCTYLTYAGIKHWNNPGRATARHEAVKFFEELYMAPINKICIENPVGYMNTIFRKPDQIIHPYYFGEPVQKRTCLWLKGLPKLDYSKTIIPKPSPMYICQGEKCKGKAINWVEGIRGVKDRSKARSKTFRSIAEAMASQWG